MPDQDSNVISLFEARKKASTSELMASDNLAENHDDETAEQDFHSVQERNMRNQQRLIKERLNANKSVLKSYRIKN